MHVVQPFCRVTFEFYTGMMPLCLISTMRNEAQSPLPSDFGHQIYRNMYSSGNVTVTLPMQQTNNNWVGGHIFYHDVGGIF